MEKNPRGFTGDEKIGVSSLPPLPLAGKSARCSHSAGSFLASPGAARSVTRLRACPGSSHPVQGAATRSWEPKKNHIKASRVLKNQVKLRAMQKCKDETIPEPRPALRTLRFAAHRSVPFQFTSFFFFFFFFTSVPTTRQPSRCSARRIRRAAFGSARRSFEKRQRGGKNLVLSRNFQGFSDRARLAATVTRETLAALLKILLLGLLRKVRKPSRPRFPA